MGQKLKYWRYLVHIYLLKRGTITRSWRALQAGIHKDYTTEPANCPYPLDFSADVHPALLTDRQGIPMIDYASLGKQYNPWFVGHIALGLYNRHHRSGDPKDLEDFHRLARWFVSEARETKHGLVWHYDFDWFGRQKKPWHSALAQAHAISVLLRASRSFDEVSYADAARAATRHLIAALDEGGCACWHKDGSLSFEEYPQQPPITVLNGHLFAALACYEAGVSLRDKDFSEHATAAWRFAMNRLPDYDMGFWSKYSLKKIVSLQDISGIHYHKLHILQLQVAAAITGEEVFDTCALRFERYLERRGNRLRALWYKRLTKLLWDWK